MGKGPTRRQFLTAAAGYGCGGFATFTGQDIVDGAKTAKATPASTPSWLSVPDGFRVSVFAEGLGGERVEPHGGANPGPRFMAMHDETLYVAVPGEPGGTGTSAGRVLALQNADGAADRVVTVVDGLNRPNSVAFHDDFLYVGETHAVTRYQLDGLGVVPNSWEVVVDMGTRAVFRRCNSSVLAPIPTTYLVGWKRDRSIQLISAS